MCWIAAILPLFAMMWASSGMTLPVGSTRECYSTETPYTGRLSHTIGPRTCQPWADDFPHKHDNHADSLYPEGSQLGAENFCRDPTGTGWPWCYTDDPAVRWQFCPVLGCSQPSSGRWEDPDYCYSKERPYKGRLHHTIGGHLCQDWTSNHPHEHDKHGDVLFPDDYSEVGAENFCRDPDGIGWPWCFTNHPDVRWEFCPVRGCHQPKTVQPPPPRQPPTTPSTTTTPVSKTTSASNQASSEMTLPVGSKEACFDQTGPYKGKLSHTISGRTCQAWVDNYPHEHKYSALSHFEEGRQVSDASNYCLSPDGIHWAWCYTTDPEVRWEHCPVNGCDEPCLSSESPYTGLVSHTVSGYKCQPWVSDHPHEHKYHKDSQFVDGSQELAGSFCRNPNGDYPMPWCYTTNPKVRWEFCVVKECQSPEDEQPELAEPAEPCFSNNVPYSGNVSTTVKGYPCQSWASDSPHKHDHNDLPENYCRSPSGVHWPWCYTTDPDVQWDYCTIKACHEECFNGESPYNGLLSHTVGGYTCQPWASDYPHTHNFHNDSSFPEGSQLAADNFCRSPNTDPSWPWCYTTDPDVKWQYCPVEGCHVSDEPAVEATEEEHSEEVEDCFSGKSPYDGPMFYTVGGRTCQPWVSGYPHEHKYHNNSMFPEGSQVLAGNMCRSPDGQHWPWCYTTDPDKRWEYCPVKGCHAAEELEEENAEQSEDCFTNETPYEGHLSHTIGGLTCQSWTSNFPHKHKQHKDSLFTDGSQAMAENFCRNPNDGDWWPWCYTTDPNVRWQFCPVKGCHAPEDMDEDGLHEPCFSGETAYDGQLAHTVTGLVCQPWVDNFPHKHKHHKNSEFPEGSQVLAGNFCRSPDGQHWPWCYTEDPNVRWQFCPVVGCDATEVKEEAEPHEACFSYQSPYAGYLSHTVSGRTCQPWVDNYPHEHKYNNDTMYAEGSQVLAENFCRNPDSKPWWPWCYTDDPEVRWEYCPVEGCDDEPETALPPPTTTTTSTTPPTTTPFVREFHCFNGNSPYDGPVTSTVGGHTCQPWVSNYPHEHKYHDNSQFPERSQVRAENFCRSPDGVHWPWCYTTDPSVLWEFCNVELCEEDCYSRVAPYTGLLSHTVSGRTCQPWVKDKPHDHDYHKSSAFPGGSQVKAENFCRNPDKYYWMPWCYTTDPDIRWEYCPVNECNADDQAADSDEPCFYNSTQYAGHLTQTIGGHTCQEWVRDHPHEHDYHKSNMYPEGSQYLAKNYCRSPDGVHWPWCFTTNRKVRWDYCRVTACGEDCFSHTKPYTGLLSHTVGGNTCQAWVENYPHEHQYHNSSLFLEGSQFLAENHCRSPGRNNWWPWCYTTNPGVEWEYCAVDGCEPTDSMAVDAATTEDCYDAKTPYAGAVSYTISGRTCQPWFSNYPHEHKYHNESMFPDGNQFAAGNLCRSPDGSHWPWCYTKDPNKSWEYCPVNGCDPAVDATLDGEDEESECFDNKTPYLGSLSHTITGRTCQPWVGDHPHEHRYHNDTMFPEHNQVLAENFCRDPDKATWWPFCYTTDPEVDWEFCPVKGCHAPEEFEGDKQDGCYSKTTPYTGHLAHTVGGYACQPWVDNFPHEHNYHNNSQYPEGSQLLAENYCRSPDGRHWPWCFTMDPNVRWDYCPVKGCDQNCFSYERPYAGRLSHTVSGRTCQPWVTNYPHEHRYHSESMFPEGDEVLAVNFCRNPESENWWPWCYTTDPEVRWEYCPVQECDYEFSCDENWLLGDTSGNCYTLVQAHESHSAAQYICENAFNSSLATFMNMKAFDALASLMLQHGTRSVWVGANKSNETWQWMDGTPWSPELHVKSRLPPFEKSCLAYSPYMDEGSLYDDFCEDDRMAVCQKPALVAMKDPSD